MTYHFTGEPRTCKQCGATYTPNSNNQKYCSVKCKMTVSMANFKGKNPEYWASYLKEKRLNTIKKPGPIKPAFNPKPCQYCRKPLGSTFNHWYHPDCLSKITKLTGIEEVGVQL